MVIELGYSAKIHSFATAKKIIFGIDASGNAGAEVKQLQASRVLVITDSGVAKAGLLTKVTRLFEEEDLAYETWEQAEPEPSVDSAQAAVDKVRGGAFDVLVGVGGGSALDITKTAAIIAKQEGQVRQYLGVTLPKPEIPFILIPTTAGTGSEVSNAAVLAVPEEDFKYVVYSPQMYPEAAIVDPLMSSTMPPALTARTGIDALTHAIEAYVSLDRSPFTDIFAEKAMKLIGQHLRAAYTDGTNMTARYGMAEASLLAGIAFGNAGTVLGHALGYAHAHVHHLPHGVSVAVTEPYVLQYNAGTEVERHTRIAELLGDDVSRLPRNEDTLRAAIAFRRLLKDLDMPSSLNEVGVTRDQLPSIADRVFRSRAHVRRNPRSVNKEEMIGLLERAFEGVLDSD
jgi:alcohol dehydrogenase class IV